MTQDRKKKLGVALGGGGAKGFAHIGALQALTEAGIEFDVVSGTSVGALVGAVYAAGNLEQLNKRAREISLTDIPLLLSPAWSRSGFFSGKNALEFLQDLLAVELIEQLPKSFAAIAVDILTGTPQIFRTGDLRQAVRASISIPGVFTPVEYLDRVLVDGGLLDPVPVEICRIMGADIVLAIDLFGEDDPPEPDLSPAEQTGQQAGAMIKQEKTLWPAGLSNALTYLRSVPSKLHVAELLPSTAKALQPGKPKHSALSLIDIVESTLAITQRQLTAYRLAEHPPDFLIQPPVSSVGFMDFHRGGPIIDLGAQAARKTIPQIREALERC